MSSSSSSKHGAGSASGKAAGDNRRATRTENKTARVEAAKPQLDRGSSDLRALDQ